MRGKLNPKETMKKLRLLMLCCALVVASPVVFTGCPTTHNVTYNTLSTVGHGVDAAMKSYSDLLVAGKVNVASLKGVAEKYAAFQAVYKAAITVARNNPNAPAPEDVLIAATSFTFAVTTAKENK